MNKVINNLPFIMQSPFLGATALITANVIIAEIANQIARIAETKIFGSCPCPFVLPPPQIVAFRITGIILSTAVMNFALGKLLVLPFNPLITAGIITLTSVIYHKDLYRLGLVMTKASISTLD